MVMKKTISKGGKRGNAEITPATAQLTRVLPHTDMEGSHWLSLIFRADFLGFFCLLFQAAPQACGAS